MTDKEIVKAMREALRMESPTAIAARAGLTERTVYRISKDGVIRRASTRRGLMSALGVAEKAGAK